MELLFMFTKITALLFCLIFIITTRNFVLKKINTYIDNRFEIELNNNTNIFERIYLNFFKNKKNKLKDEYTYIYRQKAQYIANIVTIMTISIIAFFVIFLQLKIN